MICSKSNIILVFEITKSKCKNIKYKFKIFVIVRNVIIKLNEGDAEIQCTPYRRYKDSVEQIYRAICVGFELLSTKYPENISYDLIG